MNQIRLCALPERIQERIYPEPFSGCWLWIGYVGTNGYGVICRTSGPQYVHRIVYELLFGPLPEGLHLHHTCETRSCCNPRHLEIVTRSQHVARTPTHRSQTMKVRTHCSNGHPRTPENVYYHSSAQSYECRICNRERIRKWKAKKVRS